MPLKVMIIQEEGDARDRLEQYLRNRGAEVVCSRPVWPGFFLTAKEHRPQVAIVDCSPDPGYGRECAGYLGETGFTKQIVVLAVNVPLDEHDRLKRRAPNAKIVNLDDLENELLKIDPDFGAVEDESTDE